MEGEGQPKHLTIGSLQDEGECGGERTTQIPKETHLIEGVLHLHAQIETFCVEVQ